nr:piggyBac transposable element-derived protein 4 [Nothobranchius furzeri]
MSSAQSLREFIRERLTAAAAEIFSEFEQTIVRYEEEIDRQRRLLEISWKPQINLHRIELPLHYVRRDEEVLTDQQLWNQERTSSLDQEQPEPLQEGPEPPQMKVEQDEPKPLQSLEQEELCISQDEEQFVLKQETVTSLVTPADEERDHDEPEPDRHQLLYSLFPEAEIRAAAPPGPTETMRRSWNANQALELFQQLEDEGEPASSTDDSSLDEEADDETFTRGPDSGEEMEDDSDEEVVAAEERGDHPLWESKSGIAWSPTPDTRIPFRAPASRHCGITRLAFSQVQTIEDSFDFFLTTTVLDIIMKHTNIEGRRKYDNWTDVDRVELRAFFGLLILAGVHRSHGESTASLWGEETGRPIFRATMSQRRFRLLAATVQFDDRLTRAARQLVTQDKLAPLREVWDLWVARLPLAYNPGEDVCVDEQLVGFGGRCNFKQYMPSKPAKYGIKLWVVCDVATSYAWGIIPYLGKMTKDAPAERGQGKRVVLELTEGLGGRTVTTDNFFTSLALGEELLHKKICLVGTVRRTKPELPPQLLQTRSRAVLSSLFAFTSTATAVSYIPKHRRNVLLLSTKHHRVQIQEGPQQKPTPFIDYNRCKGAVDNLNRLVATYSCRRKTRRWPMALFCNILDVSAYNALVLWLSVEPAWNQQKKSIRRRLFLQELGSSMVRPAQARRTRLPLSSSAAALLQVQQQAEPAPAQEQIRKKKCHLCRGKRSVHARFCKTCGQAVCKEHSTVVCSTCSC